MNKLTESFALPFVSGVVKVDSPLKSGNQMYKSDPKVGLGGIEVPKNCTLSNIIVQARPAVPQFLTNPTANTLDESANALYESGKGFYETDKALDPSMLIGLMFGLGMCILSPDMHIPPFLSCSHDELDLLVDSKEIVVSYISYPKMTKFPYVNISELPYHNMREIVIPKIPRIVIPNNVYNLASLFPNNLPLLNISNNSLPLLEITNTNENIHHQSIPSSVVSLVQRRDVVELDQRRDVVEFEQVKEIVSLNQGRDVNDTREVVSLQRYRKKNETLKTLLKERDTLQSSVRNLQPSVTTLLVMVTTVAMVFTVMLLADYNNNNISDIKDLFPT